MIAQLIEHAKTLGVDWRQPTWTRVKGVVALLDEGGGLVSLKEEALEVVLVERSGVSAEDVPGLLAEKATKLQPGRRGRIAQLLLVERFLEHAPHPLLERAALFLRSAQAITMGEDEDPWLTFAGDGLAPPWQDEALRAQVAEEALPDTLPVEAICAGCSTMQRPVRLYDGVIALGRIAPKFGSWNRWPLMRAGRQQADNLPLCVACMRLACAGLHHLVQGAERSGDRYLVHLGGVQYTVGTDGQKLVQVDHIELVEEALPDPAQVLSAHDGINDKKARSTALKNLKELGEQTKALPQRWTDPAWQAGYQYGVLEYVAVVTKANVPPMRDVVDAPARHLAQGVIDAHGAIQTQRDAKAQRWLRGWFEQALAVCDQAAEVPERLLPPQRALFCLGYRHALGLRGPQQAYADARNLPIVGGGVTLWAARLAAALERAGVLQHPASGGYAMEWRVEVNVGKYRRIDIAIPDLLLGVEVDGRLRGFDTRDFEGDSLRAAQLAARGWTIHRVPNGRVRTDAAADAAGTEVLAIMQARAALMAGVGGVAAYSEQLDHARRSMAARPVGGVVDQVGDAT